MIVAYIACGASFRIFTVWFESRMDDHEAILLLSLSCWSTAFALRNQQLIQLKLRASFAFLPAATKLRQSNIFGSVCQEFCSQGGGCLPHCMLGYTPPGPKADTPGAKGRHPPGPKADTLPLQTATARDQRQTPPWDTVNERAVRILLECILVIDNAPFLQH